MRRDLRKDNANGRASLDTFESPSHPSSDIRTLFERQYLDRLEASRYLQARWGIRAARQTLAKWLTAGTGPPVHYDGRYPRYAMNQLDRWAAHRLRGPYKSSSARQVDVLNNAEDEDLDC